MTPALGIKMEISHKHLKLYAIVQTALGAQVQLGLHGFGFPILHSRAYRNSEIRAMGCSGHTVVALAALSAVL